MLINDIKTELVGRPYELARVAGGWMFRTRTQFSEAIKATADLGEQSLAFTEMEMAVLCAIAYHQPIDRAGLADIFGKEVSRDLLARLRAAGVNYNRAAKSKGRGTLYLCDHFAILGRVRSAEPARFARSRAVGRCRVGGVKRTLTAVGGGKESVFAKPLYAA